MLNVSFSKEEPSPTFNKKEENNIKSSKELTQLKTTASTLQEVPWVKNQLFNSNQRVNNFKIGRRKTRKKIFV